MEAHLRAGIAIYNAGEYHAAHDAWEGRWLDTDRESDDAHFLQGLIQFTAAIYHAQDGNWAGLRGLATSAGDHLAGLPGEYRNVDVAAVRTYLQAVGDDPEHVERVAPVPLTCGGEKLGLADLGFEASAIAALVLAEEYEAYDEEPLEAAVAFARADLDVGRETSPFVALVMDFVCNVADRDVVYQRLGEHVAKRRHRESDVEGLFD